MPDVIYYSCSGDTYVGEAKMSIKSLRTKGKYTGDIILFTGVNQNVGDVDCQVVKIDIGPQVNWFRGRFIVKDFFDFSKYDKVLYTDSDTICIKPIQIMFDHHQANKVSYVVERQSIRASANSVYYMTEQQMEENKEHNTVNSGNFIMDGKEFKVNMDMWADTYFNKCLIDPLDPVYAVRHRKLGDQSAFQKLVVCKDYNANHLPRGIVSMPYNERIQDNCVIVHFCSGKLKNKRTRMMLECLNS